jgi:multidrug resistance efflux pump
MIQVGSINAGRLASVDVDVGATVTQGEVIATVTLPSSVGQTSTGSAVAGYLNTQDTQAPVTAPISGVVVQRLADPGDSVTAGQAIVAVVDPKNLWVTANIEETQISRVHVGQPVEIHIDSLNENLPGQVIAVDQATQGEFSLLPQVTTAGNFTKVTQLVPVKIAVDAGAQPLVLGSSVEVQISTR